MYHTFHFRLHLHHTIKTDSRHGLESGPQPATSLGGRRGGYCLVLAIGGFKRVNRGSHSHIYMYLYWGCQNLRGVPLNPPAMGPCVHHMVFVFFTYFSLAILKGSRSLSSAKTVFCGMWGTTSFRLGVAPFTLLLRGVFRSFAFIAVL